MIISLSLSFFSPFSLSLSRRAQKKENEKSGGERYIETWKCSCYCASAGGALLLILDFVPSSFHFKWEYNPLLLRPRHSSVCHAHLAIYSIGLFFFFFFFFASPNLLLLLRLTGGKKQNRKKKVFRLFCTSLDYIYVLVVFIYIIHRTVYIYTSFSLSICLLWIAYKEVGQRASLPLGRACVSLLEWEGKTKWKRAGAIIQSSLHPTPL